MGFVITGCLDSSDGDTVNVPEPAPDVIVTIEVPATGSTGDVVSLPSSVKNNGDAVASNFRTSLYFSTDSEITTSDTYWLSLAENFGFSDTSITLQAGQSITISGSAADIEIPATLAAGTWYIGLIADDENSVTETDESNNIASGLIEILDGVAPTAANRSPDIFATNVATNTTITVTFSEKMDPATINNNNFELKESDSSVNGNVSYDESTMEATFTPTVLLDGATSYTVTLSNGMTDLAGNSLQASSRSFTTLSHFSETGDLNQYHGGGRAVLLDNGSALYIGGVDSISRGAIYVELYDPAAGTFTQKLDMLSDNGGKSNSYGMTVTLLNNGNVLVTGGASDDPTIVSSSTYWPDTQIYNVSADTWSLGPEMDDGAGNPVARYRHTATKLTNDQVLIIGGFGGIAAPLATLFSSDIFSDDATSRDSSGANLTTARFAHTATRLPDGRVLVVGGCSDLSDCTGANVLSSVEIYSANGLVVNVSTGGGLSTGRFKHTATLLSDGKVLIAGGWDGNNKALNSAEIFDPSAETFTPVTGAMRTARARLASVLLDSGNVLLVGGLYGTISSAFDLNTAEQYNPATGAFEQLDVIDSFFGQVDITAAKLNNGKVLLIGGRYVSGTGLFATNQVYLYTP